MEETSLANYRVQQIISHLHYEIDEEKVSSLLNSLLISHSLLTWNSRGEIVYNGRTIPRTNITELIEYCLTEYDAKIPQPFGLDIFIKGLANLKIDKSLIENVQVLTMLARHEHQEPESESEDEESEDEDEDEDEETDSKKQEESDAEHWSGEDSERNEELTGECEHCQSIVHVVYLLQCPKCSWKDFYQDKNQCKLCNLGSPLSFSHSIGFCTACPKAYITDGVNENNFEPK